MTTTLSPPRAILPESFENECALLGSLILDPNQIPRIRDFVGSGDFARATHATVYRALLHVYEQTGATDLPLVTQRLSDLNQLEAVGGVPYLVELFESVPSAINAHHYAKVVHEKAMRRRVIGEIESSLSAAYSGRDLAEVIDELVDHTRDMRPLYDDGKRKMQRFSDMQVTPPQWLIPGVLEREALAGLFGDSYTGKSFLAIDWACRVATGTPWIRKEIQPASVVYAAAEGRGGLSRRIAAWYRLNGVERGDDPLFVYPGVRMDDPSSIREFANNIEAVSGRPDLIVIDTLNRSMVGDENSATDMGRFIQACDQLRLDYGATVLIVHHTGKGDKSQARGSSAFRAAMDAEYRLTTLGEDRDALRNVKATKMKDAEEPEPFDFELMPVELAGGKYPIRSAAVALASAL
jgi:hypothetical protein